MLARIRNVWDFHGVKKSAIKFSSSHAKTQEDSVALLWSVQGKKEAAIISGEEILFGELLLTRGRVSDFF